MSPPQLSVPPVCLPFENPELVLVHDAPRRPRAPRGMFRLANPAPTIGRIISRQIPLKVGRGRRVSRVLYRRDRLTYREYETTPNDTLRLSAAASSSRHA